MGPISLAGARAKLDGYDYQWWSTQLVLALRNLCAGSPEVCSVSLCER